MTLLSAVNDGDYNVTLSTNVSSYETFITVLQTTIIAVISSGIVLSNIVNLIVLVSASGTMPWATRLFLMNLSVSNLLVGCIACAPAVIPAATHRWIYNDYLIHYLMPLTGGYTVTSGVKYRELLTPRHVLFPSGAYRWSGCTGLDRSACSDSMAR